MSSTDAPNAGEPVTDRSQEVKGSVTIVSAQAAINRLLRSAIPPMSAEDGTVPSTDDDPLTPKDMELIEKVVSIRKERLKDLVTEHIPIERLEREHKSIGQLFLDNYGSERQPTPYVETVKNLVQDLKRELEDESGPLPTASPFKPPTELIHQTVPKRLIIFERQAFEQELNRVKEAARTEATVSERMIKIRGDLKQLIAAAEGLLDNYSHLLHFNEQVIGELVEDIVVFRHFGRFDPKEIEEAAEQVASSLNKFADIMQKLRVSSPLEWSSVQPEGTNRSTGPQRATTMADTNEAVLTLCENVLKEWDNKLGSIGEAFDHVVSRETSSGSHSLRINESGSSSQDSPVASAPLDPVRPDPKVVLTPLSVRKKSTTRINKVPLTDDQGEPSPGPVTRSKTSSPKTTAKANEAKRKKIEDRWRAIDYSSGKELHTKINSYVNWLTKSNELLKKMNKAYEDMEKVKVEAAHSKSSVTALVVDAATAKYRKLRSAFRRMVKGLLTRWAIFNRFDPEFARRHLRFEPPYVMTKRVQTALKRHEGLMVKGDWTEVKKTEKRLRDFRKHHHKSEPNYPNWPEKLTKVEWDDSDEGTEYDSEDGYPDEEVLSSDEESAEIENKRRSGGNGREDSKKRKRSSDSTLNEPAGNRSRAGFGTPR